MKLLSKLRKRGLIYGLAVLLVVGLVAGCGNTGSNETGTDKTINIGYVNWAECVAVSNLWKNILEEKGYTVNLTSLDVAPLFVGLSKGELDFFMDAWLPITHKTYWDTHKDKLDDYGIWYQAEAKIGLVVPKYMDINSVGDLNSIKTELNGKITGIDPGAGIMKAAATAVQEYGLDYEVIQSSEAAMLATLDKAYRSNEPVVVTGWSPHWKFAKYELKYLEDPKKAFGEAEEIHIIANKEFTTQNPEVAQMLKTFKMNDQQIGELEGLINEGMKPEEAAGKWIGENRALVDSWLKQ